MAHFLRIATALVLLGPASACQPRVALEVPTEPIVINLNIKLDADVRLRLEETAQDDFEKNPEIF